VTAVGTWRQAIPNVNIFRGRCGNFVQTAGMYTVGRNRLVRFLLRDHLRNELSLRGGLGADSVLEVHVRLPRPL